MGKVLGEYRLVPHPDAPAPPIEVVVIVSLAEPALLRLDYDLGDALDRIVIPPLTAPIRTDGLWRHSCFEAFMGTADGRYAEYNFSLSSQWASYRFDGYRAGGRDADDLPVGRIEVQQRPEGFALTAWLDIAPLVGEGALTLGLSAVIEQRDGSLSYLALAHPPGKPDFHHPDCFVLELPAPERA